ncbi:adenosylcobinamide-GDP ribazoletransferase [Microlunatus soli]|uniref:Adenosylcobinamide-GDP ribazoletransferase n=1 Tax=Microlunatus soli TaxID=630515 RepID=A0A1H1ZGQ2_9ACTN|nr:adenosylcobinamide-GDP ribazoletransferase [Microlunatus soli]SDT32908.1 cobalamin-5'-phosphate synthase [Microlunatus soli]
MAITAGGGRRLLDALAASAGLLTVFPVRPRPIDATLARGMIMLAPLAVVPVAVITAALTWLARLAGLPAPAAGLIGVAAAALGTRAFHLDGLSDTVDALGSGWDRQKALDIMKRGDIGPMGVLAMIIVVGLQAVSFGTLADDLRGAVAVAMIICLSRSALVICCARPVPPARQGGLGALVAGSLGWPTVLIIVTVAIALGGVVVGPWGGTGIVGGLLAVAAALAVVAGLVRHAVRRFGGVTGDVMGASVEIGATVIAVLSLIDYRVLP